MSTKGEARRASSLAVLALAAVGGLAAAPPAASAQAAPTPVAARLDGRPHPGRGRASRQRRRQHPGLDRRAAEDAADRVEDRLRRPVRGRQAALHDHGGERRAVQGPAERGPPGAAQARREDVPDARLPDAPQRRLPRGRPRRGEEARGRREDGRLPRARRRPERGAVPGSRERPAGDVEPRVPVARRVGRAAVRLGAGRGLREVLRREVPPEHRVRPARVHGGLARGAPLQRDRLLPRRRRRRSGCASPPGSRSTP